MSRGRSKKGEPPRGGGEADIHSGLDTAASHTSSGGHMVKTQREKGEALRTLHATSGAFLIPNPWDAGSARLLESLGFKALATTSSGFAYSLGRRDGRVKL